jgi:hypothetical protein
MSDIKKIKIVKKLDAAAFKKKPRSRKPPRATAREVVSTVSEWVTDLRSRKSEETKAAIDRLFSGGPRPSES